MATQNGWVTVTKKTQHHTQQRTSTHLAKTWAQKNARDPQYPLNPRSGAKQPSQRDQTIPPLGATYSFSSKPGETWADEVERCEAAGWRSGWYSTRREHHSWLAAAKCTVN